MSDTIVGEGLINDRYQLLRALGRGTTGMVYSAWDHYLEREVAVKILHKELIDNKEVINRFDLEIRLSARLQHPGLVCVFEGCEMTDGRIGYIMSQAIGEDMDGFLDGLRNERDHWQKMNLVDRLALFAKLLDVMAYAHDQGVVHRDLKPANIILGRHGEVWVIDWGLARVMKEAEKPKAIESAFDDLFGDGDHETTTSLRHRPISTSSEQDKVTLVGGTTETRQHARALTEAIDEVEESDATPTEKITRLSSGDTTRTRSRDESDDSRDGDEREASQDGSSDGETQISSRRQSLSTRNPVSERSGRYASSRLTGVTSRSGRHSSNQRIERSTQLGAVLGSPAYMSPEQARGEAGMADERSDVYSLGVILVELLTLHTPLEREDDEPLLSFIQRVRKGERRRLSDLWENAPSALELVCERALSHESKDRYVDSEAFRLEFKRVFAQLSASFSEMERMRLEEERRGAWLNLGRWNYANVPGLEPFTESVIAFEGEGIGQVMHPELGGVLLGGTGLQIYPVALPVADDIRLVLEVTINRGLEFTLFTRGTPPNGAYSFRVGGFGGRWLTIGRSQGQHDILNPVLLTMRALDEETTRSLSSNVTGQRLRVIVEVVGSQLQLTINNGDTITVNDPCPLIGPLHRQLALGTMNSQIVIHSLSVEQRRSPLMVPSYHVANELLRQELYPQAIAFYKQFLQEHRDSKELVEANFMLCLAYLQAGHPVQAEKELHNFLSEHIDNPLAQDAIFELSRLTADLHGGSIERAVRIVLSYQESGDLVRSRFCLWVSGILRERVRRDGLTREVERGLELLRHLIAGFSDEGLILETIAFDMKPALRECTARLLDLAAEDALKEQEELITTCREMGYPFAVDGLHRQETYVSLARKLGALSGEADERHESILTLLRHHNTIRDLLCLAALGHSDELIDVLQGDDLPPSKRIFRASLYLRSGQQDKANEDLQYCFRLMDVIETERTSQEVTSTARLAFYGLHFLPWEVVWEPIAHLSNGQEVQALAAWLAECLGDHEAASQAYCHLSEIGSGFCKVAEQGMGRLGMKKDVG